MNRFLTGACALGMAVTVAGTASAEAPDKADFKNAAKYCKALKAASGSNFASLFGTTKNAYGKCVSTTAKQQANEDAKQEKAARKNAAKQCAAERDDATFAAGHGGKTFAQFYGTNRNGSNAFGKCVSAKSAQATDQQQEARINAARTCRTEQRTDSAAFRNKYGTNANKSNAFGRCVSQQARA